MSLVEKRYAEALINLAAEKNSIDAIQRDLEIFADIYSGEAGFKDFLLNPQNETAAKKGAVNNAFSSNISKEVVNFVSLLLDKGRIKNLPDICKEFVKLADERRDILNISIVSASPLDDGQIKTITEKYKKLYQKASVKAQVKVDTSLIGGVRVVVGDKMTDASVKARLNELQLLLAK